MKNTTLYGILALVLLVASITVAYAMWSETLRVNVTVNTGEVDVKWSDYYTNDPPDTIDPGYDKDVATCLVEAEEIDEEGDLVKVNVTIVNGYPSYRCNVTLVVRNIGTIPVKLYNSSFSGLDGLPLEVEAIIPTDTQIDPPEGESVYILTIHVLQAAEENATYSFE